MNLCNETITVFNAKLNTGTGDDDYNGTVIDGVSWFCEMSCMFSCPFCRFLSVVYGTYSLGISI